MFTKLFYSLVILSLFYCGKQDNSDLDLDSMVEEDKKLLGERDEDYQKRLAKQKEIQKNKKMSLDSGGVDTNNKEINRVIKKVTKKEKK